MTRNSFPAEVTFSLLVAYFTHFFMRIQVVRILNFKSAKFNPSRDDPGRREKIRLNFYFHFFVVP